MRAVTVRATPHKAAQAACRPQGALPADVTPFPSAARAPPARSPRAQGLAFATHDSLPFGGIKSNKISHFYLKETLKISVQN